MLAIPHHSQVFSMAEIDSKEAQKKLKAGICFKNHLTQQAHFVFALTKEAQLEDPKKKTSAINRAFWPRNDKDSEGLKSLVDMESQTPPVTALSRADAKDQVDQTWFTRFVVSVPDQNKGKTSSEVELDTQTLLLTITTDVQAIMLSNDDLFDETYNDVFEAVPTEEPVSQEHQSSTPHKEKPESSTTQKTDTSYSESYSCSNTFKPYENYMPIIERQLTDHNTSMRRILENLKEVQEVVKEDLALNKKVLESTKAYTKNSVNLTELLSLVKSFDFLGLKSSVESLQAAALRQDEHDAFQSDVSSLKQDTSEIKSMMTEIFNAFKGKSFAHTATEKPPSYTEGEKADMDTKEAVKKEQPKELEVEKCVQEPVRASGQFQPQLSDH
ncbi:hypothetical protein Tco_0059542 [Tanacetum coccineum]